MWELPEVASSAMPGQIMFVVRHSITVTDFKVTVVQGNGAGGTGRWISISRLNQLPLTGLAKKILRGAKIIQ
jgi:hypothetical protein